MRVVSPVSGVMAGSNVWDANDWRELTGLEFRKPQLAKLGEFPWAESVLNSPCPFHTEGQLVKDTHFLFLGIDKTINRKLTVLMLQDFFPANHKTRFDDYWGWYLEEEFGKLETCGFRWYLMLKEIVPNSENKPWAAQQAMLPSEYEVPSVVEDVTKHLFYCQKNRRFLNPNKLGRTRSMNRHGCRAEIGHHPKARGIAIWSIWDQEYSERVGISVSRKLGI